MDAKSISRKPTPRRRGHLTHDDSERDVDEPGSLHLGMNPDYFKGTVVEAEAEKFQSLPKRSERQTRVTKLEVRGVDVEDYFPGVCARSCGR